MKNFLFILMFLFISILSYSQDLLAPIDNISSTYSTQTYTPSVDLFGDFHELVVVVGFSDKDYGYPTLQTSEYYPLLGAYPDGTLLKDYVAQNGNSIPADQWYEPLLNYYYAAVSGGLYNVDFQFVKSTNNGGTYLSDHSFSYWVTQNGGSSNSVIYNKRSLILREIADKLYNDNPNIFNDISCIHFIFQGVNNCEFYKYTTVKCAGGTIDNNITLKNVNGTVTYWTGPVSYQRSMNAVLHERFHIIGKISSHPNFTGFPDRGNDVFPDFGDHANMLWDRDMMYHNAALPGLHSLYGQPPLLSHDLIFLGWIRPDEILTVDQSNINSINFNYIKLADVNYPLATQAIANGYRRIIKVMIKENYLGGTDQKDEYFLIEYHNASEFDKSFENLDEYPTYGYNKGVLIWHIKERTDMVDQSSDNLIHLETAVPYNGWNNNPIPNDDYPRDYNRPGNWNGIYSGDFNYLDDNLVDANSKFIHLPDGGRHIWETTVINDIYNTYGWDPTGQRRFFRFQSMRSDFFTDENIYGHVTNSMTDATRPSTKEWGQLISGVPTANKTHIAITDITRHTGYMSLKAYYNYWTEDITTNTTLSGNVFIGKNITVSPGVTLTVQPGAKLNFLNGSSLIVNGTLASNGTSTNKVTFDFISPNSTTQNGIRVYTGATLNVSNTIVKRAWYGIYCNYTYASPINNWEITECNTGIYFSNTPIGISNNYIHDNWMGIALYNSSPTLTLNKLTGNTNYAVSSSGVTSIPKFGASWSQGKNKITGNSVGVCAFSNSLPMLGNNSPLDGGYNTLGENTLYNIYAITNGVIFAVNNYWGAPTPIKTYISNGAIVSYPYLTYDPTGLSKVAPLAEDAELVLLKKAMNLIEQNDLLAAREICLDIIDNYSDSYAAFNALSLLTRTFDLSEKETTKLKFKTLFNKDKKKLNAVAGLILAELDKENKLKNIDEVISKHKDDAIIEDALFAKFLYYYNDIQDKENARLVSNELDKLFPNSVSNIDAHQHLGDKDYLQKEYSFAKTDQEQKQNIVASPLPTEYNLFVNYPNPFNPVTVIKYALPYASNVNITVYNTLGQIVKEYFEGTKEAGYYTVIFDGENLSSGVYFYSIKTITSNEKENFNATKKMSLIK